jgi:phospholipid/cholesterol/gamma-HCH transport system ATP-binding protein
MQAEGSMVNHNTKSGCDAENGTVVDVRELHKSFPGQRVLDGVSFQVNKGETLSVLGRSGAGKSVLLKLLIGLQKTDSGSIKILGREITGLRASHLNEIRKRMGFSFQYSALFDSLTIEQNIEFPLIHHTKLSGKRKKDRVVQLLEVVEMEQALAKYPAELSGGMRKRVGIARALALEPEIMLFDEPTAGLDPITANGIDRLILRLSKERQMASIVVTHDMRSAEMISDRVLLLNEGKVRFDGVFQDLRKSEDPFIAEFLQ